MKLFLLGSSGLVGSRVFAELLTQNPEPELIAFTRRRLHLEGALERVSELKDFRSAMEGLSAESAFCSVGTTRKKAGSREAFEEIDLNLPLRFAVAAKEHGVNHFHMVTALGANPVSKNHYLRIKGLLERELRLIGFQGLHFYRPSLLLGDREEFRLGEQIASGAYEGLSFLFPRWLDRYRPIEVDALSRFIVRKIKEKPDGTHVWENKEMLKG